LLVFSLLLLVFFVLIVNCEVAGFTLKHPEFDPLGVVDGEFSIVLLRSTLVL
jgi:hypothetical protein